MGKHYHLEFNETINLSDSLEIQKTHEFYKKNRIVFYLVLLISFGSPFLGYYITGAWGVAVGFLISLITYFLSPYAALKVKEITKIQLKP